MLRTQGLPRNDGLERNIRVFVFLQSIQFRSSSGEQQNSIVPDLENAGDDKTEIQIRVSGSNQGMSARK